MNLICLETALQKEPAYRLTQAREAIFTELVNSWDEALGLPLKLREKLSAECPIKINGEVFEAENFETTKALITLNDELKIETVLMRHKDGRNTVCVSSQVGCPLGCIFCATGTMGFKRNLTADEVVEQVLFFARRLKPSKEKVNNIVFMGMGEPFLNYDNVLSAVRILNDEKGFNIGARKISISTSGIIEGIERLTEENLQINLAISLHASDNDTRSKLMPINKKYPLEEVLKTVDFYIKKTSRQVMFEYLLLNGINDSEKDARKLIKLMRKPLHLVNLIIYNPTDKENLSPSSPQTAKNFKATLEKSGVQATIRHHFGGDIKAACGQLIAK